MVPEPSAWQSSSGDTTFPMKPPFWSRASPVPLMSTREYINKETSYPVRWQPVFHPPLLQVCNQIELLAAKGVGRRPTEC